jgi:hypothetical protein
MMSQVNAGENNASREHLERIPITCELHSCGLKLFTMRPILRRIVRSAALRKCALTQLKAGSIGLGSGEYEGR